VKRGRSSKISTFSAQENFTIDAKKGEVQMEWLNALLFLACPLMMIFMMLGGHGHGGGHGKKAHLEHSHGMHKRIQKLEEENQRLKKRLDAFDKYDQKKTS